MFILLVRFLQIVKGRVEGLHANDHFFDGVLRQVEQRVALLRLPLPPRVTLAHLYKQRHAISSIGKNVFIIAQIKHMLRTYYLAQKLP